MTPSVSSAAKPDLPPFRLVRSDQDRTRFVVTARYTNRVLERIAYTVEEDANQRADILRKSRNVVSVEVDEIKNYTGRQSIRVYL